MNSRLLEGCAVGLSISESEDSAGRGFPSWQVNRVTVQTAAALLGQGASVVFGHDWREDGVMDAIYRFAIQFEPPFAPAGTDARPLLENFLAWPDQPRLKPEEIDRLGAILRIEAAGLPDELADNPVRAGSEPENVQRYLRARALTHMRHRLNQRVIARVSLGGRRGGSQGRYPGIVEEVLLAIQDHKPLYLAGLLGGATRQIIDAIEGKRMPPDFCHAAAMQELYKTVAQLGLETSVTSRTDREVDPARVWSTFADFGVAGLSRLNRLSEAENLELFHTLTLDQAIGLILAGIARIHET